MPNPPPKSGSGVPPESFGTDELWRFLFADVEADSRAGAFRLFKQRLLILRPETLVDLQKHLEQTVGLSSKGFLYLAGEKSAREGHSLFRPPMERDPVPSNRLDVLRRMVESVALLGWGRFEVTAVEAEAHRYILTLENSPIAEAYGVAKKPVCHLLAGWLAGTAQGALGEDLLCEETACRSQGKPRCEFELRPMPAP